jgi:hypothetical protein
MGHAPQTESGAEEEEEEEGRGRGEEGGGEASTKNHRNARAPSQPKRASGLPCSSKDKCYTALPQRSSDVTQKRPTTEAKETQRSSDVTQKRPTTEAKETQRSGDVTQKRPTIEAKESVHRPLSAGGRGGGGGYLQPCAKCKSSRKVHILKSARYSDFV